jgi:hypothetical protein
MSRTKKTKIILHKKTIKDNKKYNVRKLKTNRILQKKTYKLKKHSNLNILNGDGLNGGGLIGAIGNIYNLYKFKKLATKMKIETIEMQRRVNIYKSQLEIFKKFSEDRASIATNYIINTKKKTILEIISNDINTPERIRKVIEPNLKLAESNEKIIDKKIIQTGKNMIKQQPQFNKLNSILKKDVNKFQKFINDYEKLTEFREKISGKKITYEAGLKVDDKKARADVVAYKKYKKEYDEVLALDDQVIEGRNKLREEINELMIFAEDYKDEFEAIKTKKESIGADLSEWTSKYTKSYTNINETIDKTRDIINNLEEIKIDIDSMRAASIPVMETIHKQRNIDSFNYFTKGVERLIEIVKEINRSINYLKKQFLMETPAGQLSSNFSVDELGVSHVIERLIQYNQQLKEAADLAAKAKAATLAPAPAPAPANPPPSITDPKLIYIVLIFYGKSSDGQNLYDKYKDNFDTITKKLGETIAKIDTIKKDNKKLSENLQKLNQSIIDIKTVESKVIKIESKAPEPLYGKYSWILEDVKRDESEIGALGNTSKIIELLKENMSKDEFKKYLEPSQEEILELITLISSDIKNLNNPRGNELFNKIFSSVYNLKLFFDKFEKMKLPSTNSNENITVCKILNSLLNKLGNNSSNKDKIDVITNFGNKYQIDAAGKMCNPLSPPSSAPKTTPKPHSGASPVAPDP